MYVVIKCNLLSLVEDFGTPAVTHRCSPGEDGRFFPEFPHAFVSLSKFDKTMIKGSVDLLLAFNQKYFVALQRQVAVLIAEMVGFAIVRIVLIG
jgi:hypothetical protein